LPARRGVRLVTASVDDLTDSDDLGRKMMRQVAGAFMEYETGAPGRQTARCPRPQAQEDRYEGGWAQITR